MATTAAGTQNSNSAIIVSGRIAAERRTGYAASTTSAMLASAHSIGSAIEIVSVDVAIGSRRHTPPSPDSVARRIPLSDSAIEEAT